MPAMLIFDRAVVYELSILAARGHHRYLAFEIDERFEHGFLLADRRPSFRRPIGRIDSELALTVVAERRGFQHRRTSQIGDSEIQPLQRTNLAIRRGGQAGMGEQRLLANALLRGMKDRSAGPDRR